MNKIIIGVITALWPLVWGFISWELYNKFLFEDPISSVFFGFMFSIVLYIVLRVWIGIVLDEEWW